MELGALICTPRQTKCLQCPVGKAVSAPFAKTWLKNFRISSKRTEPTQTTVRRVRGRREQKFLVRQRPSKVVNAHLWEFPNVELNRGRICLKGEPFHFAADRTALHYQTFHHAIPNHLEAFRALLEKRGKILPKSGCEFPNCGSSLSPARTGKFSKSWQSNFR